MSIIELPQMTTAMQRTLAEWAMAMGMRLVVERIGSSTRYYMVRVGT
jgi:hypothetical protein